MQKILTKSKYKIGLNCTKSLWLEYNQKEILPKIDESSKFRIEQGFQVGNLAKQYFKEGFEIQEVDILKTLNITKQGLNKHKIIFEAGFMYENSFTRADILIKQKDNSYKVIEVKSSTYKDKIKKEHIQDLAYQKYIYEKCGLNISSYNLMLLNSEYKKQDELDLNELFTIVNVTDELEKEFEKVKENIKLFHKIINQQEFDENLNNCESPKSCPYPNIHWNNLPKNNVFNLYYGSKKSKELYQIYNILDIKNIQDEVKLTPKQQIQIKATKNNETYLDRYKIQKFIDSLEYPLYFIDFETFQTPIPHFKNTSPYQKIPFQFSLHIKNSPTSKLEHIEFLQTKNQDPRLEFYQKIQKNIKNQGSIIVYNQAFEKSILNQIAKEFPQFEQEIKKINERFIDLLDIFKNFHYYNPNQQGSCSIKKVLPSILPEFTYEGLEISNGDSASIEYFKTLTSKKDNSKVFNALLEYCELDTLAMVKILEELERLCKN